MSKSQNVKFDYRGLDNANNIQLYIRNLIALEEATRSVYVDRLEKFNQSSLEHNPEPFRFLEKENCSIIAFVLPFEFNFSDACQIFFLSTPGKRTEDIHIMTQEDLEDLDEYSTTGRFFTEKILPSFHYHRSQIVFSISNYYETLNINIDIFAEKLDTAKVIELTSIKNQVLRTIKEEISTYQKINKKPLSYFAKDVYKFPFSILDLKPLVELVNDDDFSYQLDQAMAAYHENLFLPCAATLGVVLESLCIKILEVNHVRKVKSGDTQLGVLKDRLRQEGITSRRDHTRLEVAYKMRNMASHSSPGIALKEDCHFMLNVINTIAFEYLSVD